MRCPNCKIEDKEENEVSYFVYFWNVTKFMFMCTKCGYVFRPSKEMN